MTQYAGIETAGSIAEAADITLDKLRDFLLGCNGFAVVVLRQDTAGNATLRMGTGELTLKGLAAMGAEALTFGKMLLASGAASFDSESIRTNATAMTQPTVQ